MKIQISRSTSNESGSFSKPLLYFQHLVDEYLEKENLGNTFEEIELILAYPRKNDLESIKNQISDFANWYNNLPIIRVNRKYKRISLTIKFPEFYIKPNIEVAKHICKKLIKYFPIIEKKKRESDNFSVGKIYQVLEKLIIDLDKPKHLEKELIRIEHKIDNQRIEEINESIDKRKKESKVNNKRLIGIRVYDTFSNDFLLPYRYIYNELFNNLLLRAEIMTPGYDEIYVQIGKSIEEAKLKGSSVSWNENAYCEIDKTEYSNSNEKTKSKLVLKSIANGLTELFKIDGLDLKKLNLVIDQIKEEGLSQELIYTIKENDNYFVEIFYHIPPNHREKPPFSIRIKNKKSGKITEKFLNRLYTFWAPYSFNKIDLLRDKVRIKASTSARAVTSLEADGLPKQYEIEYEELNNST